MAVEEEVEEEEVVGEEGDEVGTAGSTLYKSDKSESKLATTSIVALLGPFSVPHSPFSLVPLFPCSLVPLPLPFPCGFFVYILCVLLDSP